MKRVLMLAVVAAATSSAGVSFAQPRGASPPPGAYWQSCRNVSTAGYGPNATVTAECRDDRGRWRQTSLQFAGCREIVNRNGNLDCRSAGPGGPGGGYPGGPGGGRPPFGRSSITLFSGPGFSGQPFTAQSEITNLPKQYNDRAMSLRIEGRGAWQVCSDSDFRGRCQVFDRDDGDLRRSGLAGQVSSMRPAR